MRRLYGLSSWNGKEKELEKMDHRLEHGSRQTEIRTLEIRALFFSLAWPDKTGIYQVCQHRCICWTAECSTVYVLQFAHLKIFVSTTCLLIFPFICECVYVGVYSMCVWYGSAMKRPTCSGDPLQGRGSSCWSLTDLSGYIWSLANK